MALLNKIRKACFLLKEQTAIKALYAKLIQVSHRRDLILRGSLGHYGVRR